MEKDRTRLQRRQTIVSSLGVTYVTGGDSGKRQNRLTTVTDDSLLIGGDICDRRRQWKKTERAYNRDRR